MPMIVELPIAMLACARIGAAHSVIFGGFSPDSIVDRVNDSECVALITADQGWRRGQKVPLKANCDDAIAKGMPSLKHVVVAKRVGDPVTMQAGRDVWWDDVVADQSTICEPERMNAEDLLYLLYTSGTTAKPKGIKHTTGGYLTGVTATHKLVFDLKEDRDVYWCAADIGWVTGHSYIVYGPLCNGATSVIYEGTPDFPDKDRLWSIIERYKVTILYTAPTAIRTFMKWGTEFVERHDLSSLRLLGSVGEPINPEAWMWYYEHIGGGRCPVVDTWWQTETGAIMITPLPGITTLKPGSATKPFPGILPDIVNDKGETVPIGGGYIVLKRPWPSMLRGIYGDDERYRRDVLVEVSAHVPRRRRLPARRRRRLLVPGPHRRRDERQRPPHLDDRGRVRAGRLIPTSPRRPSSGSDDITGQAICAFVTRQEPRDRLAGAGQHAARPRRARSSGSSAARST
jgi:acetyl-CoA synthetase